MLSKDLTAATLKPTVLSILAEGDSYGYQIIRRAFEASEDRIELAEGAIYPILHRLERQDLVESYWKVAENGRRRKYYRLKTEGKAVLQKERVQWEAAARMLNNLWGGKPCLT